MGNHQALQNQLTLEYMTKVCKIYILLKLWCLINTLSYSESINAKSADLKDINDAISAASSGDTILIPEENATWNETLLIKKGITLKGKGIGLTIIISNLSEDDFLIVYEPDEPSLNEYFRITGFSFDCDGKSGGILLKNETTHIINKIRIDHNKIFDTDTSYVGGTSAGRGIKIKGTVYGVIDSNIFENCGKTIDSYGNFRDSWDNLTTDFGTVDNMYYEDNAVKTYGSIHSGGWGGRYCTRFNQYQLLRDGSGEESLVDAHGNQPSGVYSTMIVEAYRNTFTVADNCKFDHRGGKGIFFDNIIDKGGYSFRFIIREEYDDSISPTSNPTPQHVSSSYYWNNMVNGANANAIEAEDCCNALSENSEFWNLKPDYNGNSPGIGVGTYNEMQSITSCNEGDAFWVTDRGNWNSLGEDGVLYRCNGNNQWVEFYEPFTYPHPLRGKDSELDPPTRIRILD